jgi:hypothetical protein
MPDPMPQSLFDLPNTPCVAPELSDLIDARDAANPALTECAMWAINNAAPDRKVCVILYPENDKLITSYAQTDGTSIWHLREPPVPWQTYRIVEWEKAPGE